MSQAPALGVTQGNDATSSTHEGGESKNPGLNEIGFSDDQEDSERLATLANFHEKWLPSLMEEMEDFRNTRSRGSAQLRKQPKGNQNRGPQNSRQTGGRRNCVQSMQRKKGDEKLAAKQSCGPQSRWISRRILRDTMQYQGINKGSMNDQGLTQDDDNFEGGSGRFKAPFEGRILELDSVNFEGEDFHKNMCYFVDNDNLDERQDGYSVFAIKNFLKGDDTECESALCAELVLFEKTTLETVQKNPNMLDLVGRYVQRAGHDKEIPLADLGEELESEQLPAWKYFEREKGDSSRMFGFADTSKPPVRNGRRSSRLRAIDFYAGAGLASRGFERTGFDIIAGIEKDEDAAKSYSNIHGAKLFDVTSNECMGTFTGKPCKAIFHNTTEEFLKAYEKNEAFRRAIGPIDLVIFCPPCQGFSGANVNQEGNVEENNRESLRVFDAAKLIRPKSIVFENVCGMWRKKFIENYVQQIVYGLLDKAFNVQFGKLWAADFGDAQKRPRVIIIASLSQIGLPVYPRPTHGHSLIPFVTVQDALRPEEGKHPEKENPINDDGAERDAKQPAPAVRASKPGPHYNENRFYTLVEHAIIMGEGAWFVSKLEGNKAAKQRQIGNGVPRELAKAIGRALEGVLRWNWVGVVQDDDEPMQSYWVGADETNPQSEVNEPDIEQDIKPDEIKSEFKTEIKPENIKSESGTDIRPEAKPNIEQDTKQSAL